MTADTRIPLDTPTQWARVLSYYQVCCCHYAAIQRFSKENFKRICNFQQALSFQSKKQPSFKSPGRETFLLQAVHGRFI